MAVKLDPDLWRSASHRNQIQHLTAPLAAGAVNTRLSISNTGLVDATELPGELLREPLLLITLATTLDTRRLRVNAVLSSSNPPTPLQTLEFAPYTEAGAALLLYRPPVDQDTQTASGFVIALTVTEFANEQDATGTPILLANINQRLEAHLLQGLMGRMLYLLGAEKQRLRRQAREIVAMQSLDLARDNALDRLGADLGVPRFVDFLRFRKPEPGEAPAIFNQFQFGQLRFGAGFSGEIITEPRREPDAEYRRRLAIYHPFLIPNHSQILKSLNGSGTATDPNRGLLSFLGVQQRFQVIEESNSFSIAIHLVAAGDIAQRDNFLTYIRNTHLIFPNLNAITDQLHRDRPLRQITKLQINDLRTRLSQNFDFTFDANAAIAPMLAAALDRVGRCRRALGVTTSWQVFRAQDSRTQAGGGSSRYELGLGVEVALLTPAQLTQMATQLADPGRPRADDAAIEGLLQSMTPRSPADDPEGRWLLEPCGIKTAHRTLGDRLYLSHLPIFGTEITGAASVNPGNSIALTVRYNAPGDPGSNFVLSTGLAAALASWTAAGNDPWTVLPDATARAVWDLAQAPGFKVKQILAAAGLTASDTPAAIVQRLKLAPEDGGIPEDLFETIRLPTSLAQGILAGQDSVVDSLRSLVRLLRQNGLSAALPLITGANEIVLVVGVTSLPGVGVNLSERQNTGFRWYVVPIYPGASDRQQNQAPPSEIGSTGSRTQLTPSRLGLLAVVAVGYARRGLTDPYQFRIQLPDNAVLTLPQYEFLMNLLQHLHPVGIEVDTFAIRQNHVDLDEDGNPEPLQPNVSKTYRQFRRSRYRGTEPTNPVET